MVNKGETRGDNSRGDNRVKSLFLTNSLINCQGLGILTWFLLIETALKRSKKATIGKYIKPGEN